MTTQDRSQAHPTAGLFKLFVDGQEFEVDRELITGREIMKLGNIPIKDGLIQLLPDGTQVQISADQVVDLKQGDHFKKPPHFNRG